MADLWIVTPVLRDVESFSRLRTEIAAACSAAALPYRRRHLVVDDSAGIDPEMQTLSGLDDVEVLTPPFNLGHQRAIVLGLRTLAPRLAADDVVVTMDADGEDQPNDVPRLVQALHDEGTPLAVARRTSRTESFRFRMMYLFFRLLFRTLTGTTVRSGNFAAQRAGSLAVTVNHPSFDLCYSSSLLALPRPTAMVPCARGHRFAGRSRMSTYGLVAHGVRMLLPYSERIAVRAFVLSLASLAGLVGFGVLMASGVLASPIGGPAAAVLLLFATAFGTGFVAFVVLFSGFAQASAVAMKGIGASGAESDAA